MGIMRLPCQADVILPKETMSYKSETIPKRLGSNFHADVLIESKQKQWLNVCCRKQKEVSNERDMPIEEVQDK